MLFNKLNSNIPLHMLKLMTNKDFLKLNYLLGKKTYQNYFAFTRQPAINGPGISWA